MLRFVKVLCVLSVGTFALLKSDNVWRELDEASQ